MKKLKHKKYIILLLSCFSVGCIGFSSWNMIYGDIPKFNLDVSTGELISADYKGAVFYLENSEKGFDYYVVNNIYYYTNTSFSLDFIIYRNIINSSFETDISVHFGISYSYDKNFDFDIFNNSNSSIIAPQYFVCKIANNEAYYLNSSNLVYTKKTNPINELQNTYSLKGEILLYSKTKPSLYSLVKAFPGNEQYVKFTVCFDFEITNSLSISNDLNYLNFEFDTSLEGKKL